MLKTIVVFIVLLLLISCDVTPTPTLPPITITSTVPPITVTPTPTVPTACTIGDQLPYVYHPNRLAVIQPCVKILARIEALRNEADGDIHIFARLNDADAQQYLNAGNAQE